VDAADAALWQMRERSRSFSRTITYQTPNDGTTWTDFKIVAPPQSVIRALLLS